MPTIRHLAQLAGVSVWTVSMALRDSPEVSAATRQRIHALAQACNYRPNRLALGAISGRSRTLGILLPTVEYPFCSRLLRGMLDAAFDADYRGIPLITEGRIDRLRMAVHQLLEQRVEGILIYQTGTIAIPTDIIFTIRSHNAVPIGIDTTSSDEPIACVRSDELAVASLALDALRALGHRHVTYVDAAIDILEQRRQAFVTQAKRLGLDLTVHLLTPPGDQPLYACHAPFLPALLAQTPSPTALITREDELAMRLLHEASYLGIPIPDALSLLGIANLPLAQVSFPQLSTIEQHPETIGRTAVEWLLTQLAAGTTPAELTAEIITIPPTLIPRGTCGACHSR
jgi:DNA-binding LacI/PurR family transcriptional regulator